MNPKQRAAMEQAEAAAFESWWRTEQLKTFPSDYDLSLLEHWGINYKSHAKDAWMARAAIAAHEAKKGTK